MRAKELLGKLQRRVNWLQVLTQGVRYIAPAVLGHPHLSAVAIAHDVAKGAYNSIKEEDKEKRLTADEIASIARSAPEGEENARRSIRDFHKDFGELVAATGIRTVVVFIDDLDRCLPDTIISTLEAIKLFLFVPGTAFVLGADERLIEYAVRQRFPELPGTAAEVGRDYLEKLVQIPIRIPQLSGAELHSYLNALFAQLRLGDESYAKVCKHLAELAPEDIASLSLDVESVRNLCASDAALPGLEEDIGFVAQIAPVIGPVLGGNPRRAKRFLNTLLLRLEMGQARGLKLRRQVLAKLMLLEYLKPGFFKQLAALQAEQGGKPSELERAESLARSPKKSPGAVPEKNAAPEVRRTGTGDTPTAPIIAAAPKPLPEAILPWFADEWMASWLALEPELDGVDMRPYFYVAHDRIGAQTGASARLSPAASQVLERLLSEQTATRNLGMQRSGAPSAPDAAAVFDSLGVRLQQAEKLDRQSPHRVLLEFVAHRPELLPQTVSLYGSIPEGKLTLSVPPELYAATKATPSETACLSLLERWCKSPQQQLANAATTTMARKDK